MKIVIDCFKLIKGEGKSAGIYNFTVNLVKNLAQYIMDNNTDDQLIVFGNGINQEDFSSNVEYHQISGYSCRNKLSLIVWELFGAPLEAKKIHADVIIYPRGFCGLIHPVSDIVIIHDMIPFYYNEKFPGVLNRPENAYIMNRLAASAKTAKKVITISEYSKRDIIKYSGISKDKVTVIPNGCNEVKIEEVAAMPPQTDNYRQKFGNEKNCNDYISAITTKLPHKNAKGILKVYEAYYQLCLQRQISPLSLHIIGITKDTFMQLSKVKIASDNPWTISEDVLSHIEFIGYIKENEILHREIAKSEIFLFLSLYEGFGFPPLEAMQLSVPVVCSDKTSLPEVTADAALLVDPDNQQEVAEALLKLQMNDKLCHELIKKGHNNIERFNWSTVSKKYYEALF